MTTLAFDQSTNVTGYSIWKDKSLTKYGVIDRSDMKNDASERFNAMCDDIIDLIKRVKPDRVIMEDIAQQQNVKVLKVLARLQGIMMYHCHILNIPVEVIAPTAWRKKIGFEQGKMKRDELKKMALDYVKTTYGYDVIEDVAEAICIGAAVR